MKPDVINEGTFYFIVSQSKIAVLENLPVSELRLFSVGAPLADEINISTLTSATVDVTVPLLGGMIISNLMFFISQFACLILIAL